MLLSWDVIHQEVESYLRVMQKRLMIGEAVTGVLKRFTEDLYSNNNTGGGLAMGGLTGKALSSRGEEIPGDNFDKYGTATLGVAVGQAALTGVNIALGAAAQAYVTYTLHSRRPFLSSAGAHQTFADLILQESPSGSFNILNMIDISRALSFVFDRELMAESFASLVRSERLMQLMDILLLESKRCGGPRHSFTEAVGSLRTAGVDPWTDNREGLSEDAALAILSKASNEARWRPRRSVPIPRDFGKFFEAHPTWDGFALILLWKAQRLEAALHEIDRGLLHEAWSCPTPSEAPDPVESEREATWDWLTEKETATIIRRGSRFPGRGHPAVDKLGLRVREEEVVRRATTEELPPEFSNIAPTFVELPPFEIDQILTDSRILDRQALRNQWSKTALNQRVREVLDRAALEKKVTRQSEMYPYMNEPAILKHYGGKAEVAQAIFEEKDVLPMFQLLRTVDMGDWWKKALEMKGSSGTGLTPELG